ncbi:glycosyltransferase family 39 protein [bacterium]|nr:glycosyltransferase family 39 protein [bacterium]
MKPSRLMLWILVLGALLRLYGLGTESLWLDEATTARRMGMTYGALFTDSGNGTQLPLYFWISKFWCSLAGTGEFALRFPAAIFGIFGILMVYHLGRKLFTQPAGLWGAFFAAVNPYLIHFSQEARPYTLLALLAMVSWYYMLHLFRDFRMKHAIGYVLSTVAVLCTHPLGFLILLTHLAGLFIFRTAPGYRSARHNLRQLSITAGVTILLYLPLVFRLISQFSLKLEGNSVASWIPEPGFLKLFSTAINYFMNPWLGVVALIIATLAAVFRSMSDRKAQPAVLFCLAVWVSFIAIPWLLSVTITPMFVERYTIPFLPMLLIVLGWATAGFELLPRRIVVTLLLVMTVFPIFDYHTKLDKTPWREGGQYLSGKLRGGDLLIWDPGWNDQIGDYYFDVPGGVESLYVYQDTPIQPALDKANRIWLIIPGAGNFGMKHVVETDPHASWQLVSTKNISEGFARNPHALYLSDLSFSLYEKTTELDKIEYDSPSPAAEGGS